MSRFSVKRSLKQLYIEKHAVEYLLARKKADRAIKGYEPSSQELSDIQAEEDFLAEVVQNIQTAEEIASRKK